jgi:serine protease Do
MKRNTLILSLVAVGLVIAASAVAMVRYAPHWLSVGWPTGQADGPAAPVPGYRAVVEQAAPAVVGVTAVGQATPNLLDGPFFNQGSGFILDSTGLILTNAHVVQDASAVSVTLMDRREFSATVLGLDLATDIAVLRIQASDLPRVRLGDARTLRVGDPVLAIGSPFGLAQSATQGIVSATGRTLPGDAIVPFIQTDAAVNPGNSGGPLFNASGAVVGINAQIYSLSGSFQGLSFAIPINLALKVKDQIVASGRASHAFLGVGVQDMNPGLAAAFGLSRHDGSLVALVAPDSPAAGAGLRPGDVITAFNGRAVTHYGDLSECIGDAAPGQTVRLSIWRDRTAHELMVRFGQIRERERPVGAPLAQAPPGEPGLALRTLNAQELAATRLRGGLLVQTVAGPAARAGLRPGDLLLAVNSTPVSAVTEVEAIVHGRPGRMALLIQRGDDRAFVLINLE